MKEKLRETDVLEMSYVLLNVLKKEITKSSCLLQNGITVIFHNLVMIHFLTKGIFILCISKNNM